jgi:7,8-dihydropterin-6-yl-methyl-4-(beta-D-ribofuranosyl)aminobenzene 5'-phosphate synthase
MKKINIIGFISIFVASGLIIFPRFISMPTQVQDKEQTTYVQPKVEAPVSPTFGPRLTIVYDNYQYRPDLQTDWGFACLLEGAEKTVLFDSGADGSILLSNMNQLGIEPAKIDIIVLSHIHSDHTGGLFDLLKYNHQATVYVPASFPNSFKEQVKEAGASLVEISEARQICPYVYTTGEMGTAIREQALIINTDQGLIVITGCAHPGVVEIATQAKEFLDNNLFFIMGGFHLLAASENAVNDIINDLQRLGVVNVAPCHCSGDQARQMFKNAFQDHYFDVGVGRIIEFDNLK